MMQLFKRFLKDTRGNVVIITAASIVVLVTLSGFGIELGRQQMLRLQLQQASDSAALAAAIMEGSLSNEERAAIARRYFELNFPAEFLGVARPTPKVSVSDGAVTVDADASVNTIFGKVSGVSTIAAGGGSTVSSGYGRKSSDYDVVMVVDESGSTSATQGKKTLMDIEKDSLLSMLGEIMPGPAAVKNLRFGLIGYTGSITTHGPLTSDPATARSYVSSLQIRCQNYDHYGLDAAANMVTGKWSEYKAPKIACTLPAWQKAGAVQDYGVEENTAVAAPVTERTDGQKLSATKHVVLITDGLIMVEPPLCGGGAGGPCQASYDVFLQACDRVKATGAIMHTISFVSQAFDDVKTLEKCASLDGSGKPRYYFAPDGATLRSILSNVATTIRNTRIVR